MKWDTERLYTLLPAIYRIRDQAQGEPLKGLLAAIAEQIALLDEDLDQLYDDQFIETCADWAIPYIGELIGYRPIHHGTAAMPIPRAEVANTIAYRRRKGTALVLEQLAVDVTGWQAHAVEFFEHLITSQYLNHLRPENRFSPDLRQWQPLKTIDTAFDSVAHTVDVRHIASDRGRYNIPNVGLFLWRLQAYPVHRGTARPARDGSDRTYTFHPLGIASPLFNRPRTETAITQLSEPIHVPHPLSRRPLYAELEALRQARAQRQPANLVYFRAEQPVFEVRLDGTSIPAAEILICNLSEPRPIPSSKAYAILGDGGGSVDVALPIRVAVDPVLGQLALPTTETPGQVEVSYAYGFSHDIGGGPYDRRDSVLRGDLRPVTWQAGVSQTDSSPQFVTSLATAIAAWNDQADVDTVGVIAIMDSHTYLDPLPPIQLPARSQLMIVAADWPIADPTAPPDQRRIPGQFVPSQIRPHILGSLVIAAIAAADETPQAELFLNGLLVEGAVQLQTDGVTQLFIDHCTLTGGVQRTAAGPAQQFLDLRLDGVISGPINLPQQEATLTLGNTLLDSALPQFAEGMTTDRTEPALTASLAHLEIQTSTVLGPVTMRSIEASNSLFVHPVTAIRRQTGCVRFCYLPLSSLVPRRYRCQPATTAEEIRVQPVFTAVSYGDPGYGQLSDRTPLDLRQGADDEAEIGVFHDLYRPQREINLRTRLDDYLRFGLAAGIVYAT